MTNNSFLTNNVWQGALSAEGDNEHGCSTSGCPNILLKKVIDQIAPNNSHLSVSLSRVKVEWAATNNATRISACTGVNLDLYITTPMSPSFMPATYALPCPLLSPSDQRHHGYDDTASAPSKSFFPHTTQQPCPPSISYQTKTMRTSKHYLMILKATQRCWMNLQTIPSLRLSSWQSQPMTLKATQGRQRMILSLWT